VAETTLARTGLVTPIDVLTGLGWLTPANVENWRRGRVPYLERVTQASLGKLSTAMRPAAMGTPTRAAPQPDRLPVMDPQPYDATVQQDRHPHIEQAYATHWIGPTQQAHQPQRAEQSHHRPTPDS
jgi:hypothetical protein